MLCPVCAKEMLVLEFELVEIDHCVECGGVWLDSGELGLIGRLFDAAQGGPEPGRTGRRAGALHGDLLAALEKGRGEPDKAGPKRRCPVCRKRLLRVRPSEGTQGKPPARPQGPQGPQPRNIQVEKCPGGDGLWFEAGSLQTVIQAAGPFDHTQGRPEETRMGGAEGGNVFVRFLADLDAHRGSAEAK